MLAMFNKQMDARQILARCSLDARQMLSVADNVDNTKAQVALDFDAQPITNIASKDLCIHI